MLETPHRHSSLSATVLPHRYCTCQTEQQQEDLYLEIHRHQFLIRSTPLVIDIRQWVDPQPIVSLLLARDPLPAFSQLQSLNGPNGGGGGDVLASPSGCISSVTGCQEAVGCKADSVLNNQSQGEGSRGKYAILLHCIEGNVLSLFPYINMEQDFIMYKLEVINFEFDALIAPLCQKNESATCWPNYQNGWQGYLNLQSILKGHSIRKLSVVLD